MGLIAAVAGSASGVLADQWKEYFYCEALPADTLVVKGRKKVSGRSTNTKGTDNIISNGSVIAVADGQCMVIVDQGKVVDFCAETGEYTYDMSTEPSLFDGGKLGSNIKAVFANIGKRIGFGGEAPKDQRIYYFNTKEIMGNKYGTPNPVPFRVVDERAGIDMDVSIRCFGEYSYKITNPLLFYTNVCGNVTEDYTRDILESQLRAEFLTALQPAFSRISLKGIRYSQLPGCTMELAEEMRVELSGEWKDRRGIEIERVGVNSVTADPEDEKTLKELQKSAAFIDPGRAAAYMTAAKAQAMKDAANNAGGAAVGFMGMNIAAGAGNETAALYQMAQQQAAAATAAAPAPAAAPAADAWTCPSCGKPASGKFCTECGTKKPVADEWTCSCGSVNKGKFCPNCGASKPAAVKCAACGWEPEAGAAAPKFCPECGKPFA